MLIIELNIENILWAMRYLKTIDAEPFIKTKFVRLACLWIHVKTHSADFKSDSS